MTNITPELNSDSRFKEAIREMLLRKSWTHMVTLTINDGAVSISRARNRLKDWDARLSRELLGPRWLKKPDERLVWFAFLESPRHNTHWHLVVDALPTQFAALDRRVERVWTGLVPSGTTRTDLIDNQGRVTRYITKQLRDPLCYMSFYHSLELIRARA